MIDREAALKGIRDFLEYIGEDPMRPGLRDTPERFLNAWDEDWGSGYYQLDAPEVLIKLFESEPGFTPHDNDQMVLVRDIAFFSTCEHHLAPFFGTAAVAYIPHGSIIGLSKVVRVVEHFARRLQVQERLTAEIANFLATHLSPDVAVTMNATHLCMVSRGVRQPNARTVTTALRGVFREEPSAHEEFIRKTT